MASDDLPPTPEPVQGPETVEDLEQEGWRKHVHGDHQTAEEEFRQAVAKDPQSVDGYYGLGLALKLQRRNTDAIQAFQKTIELVNSGVMSSDTARATMLRHLSKWHIVNLEKGLNVEQEP